MIVILFVVVIFILFCAWGIFTCSQSNSQAGQGQNTRSTSGRPAPFFVSTAGDHGACGAAAAGAM